MTQEEHYKKYGYYSHMLAAPTKEEAVRHALNQLAKIAGK